MIRTPSSKVSADSMGHSGMGMCPQGSHPWKEADDQFSQPFQDQVSNAGCPWRGDKTVGEAAEELSSA